MGYEDVVKVKLNYLESRFICGFLVEKYEQLEKEEQTEQIKEQMGFVRSVHNKIMKQLER